MSLYPPIRSRDLKLSDVPSFDPDVLDVDASQWEAFDRFALSFDGYDFTGLGTEIQHLDTGVREHFTESGTLPIADLTWNRLFLSIEQRRMHATYSGAARWPPERARYIAALLESVREAIRRRPEPILTKHLIAAQVPEMQESEEPIPGAAGGVSRDLAIRRHV
jgi:hypothetical protein